MCNIVDGYLVMGFVKVGIGWICNNMVVVIYLQLDIFFVGVMYLSMLVFFIDVQGVCYFQCGWDEGVYSVQLMLFVVWVNYVLLKCMIVYMLFGYMFNSKLVENLVVVGGIVGIGMN